MLGVQGHPSAALQGETAHRARFFGRFLVEQGVIADGALRQAVDLCETVNHRFGDVACAMGHMTPRQVRIIHARQRHVDARFGDLAVRSGFLSEAQRGDVLANQSATRLRIGDALHELGHATSAEIGFYLGRFQREQAYTELAAAQPVPSADPALLGAARGVYLRLLSRLALVEAKLDPPCAGPDVLDCCYRVAIGIRPEAASDTKAIALSVHFGASLAQHLVMTMLELDAEDCDAELVESAVCEFANMLAGQVQRGALAGVPSRILLPRSGVDPFASVGGVAYPVCTPVGAGGLVVASCEASELDRLLSGD